LGVDTNVLVAFLDKKHPDHPEAKKLEDFSDTATNPTIMNQTKAITKLGLYIGLEYGLGGRDCLILANFLSNNIEWIVTFDRALFNLGELSIDEKTIRVIHPGDL
jgi:predicted nucleic acid-binding protein